MKNKKFRKKYTKKDFSNKNKKAKSKSINSKKKKNSKFIKPELKKSITKFEEDFTLDELEEQNENSYSQFLNIFAKKIKNNEEMEDMDSDESDFETDDNYDDFDFHNVDDDSDSNNDKEKISNDEDCISNSTDRSDCEIINNDVNNKIKNNNDDNDHKNNNENDDGDENDDADDYREIEEKSDEDDPLCEQQVNLSDNQTNDDPFNRHLDRILEDSIANKLLKPGKYNFEFFENDNIGVSKLLWREEMEKIPLDNSLDLQKMHIKKKILEQLENCNSFSTCKNEKLTNLQMKLINVMNSYKDLCFLSRNFENCEDIRLLYTLHAVNHILKTRSKVVTHNFKIKSKHDDIPEEYRDQGFTRPKVLIVLPFRNSAYKVINIISLLLNVEKGLMSNKQRFIDEYFEDDEELKRGHKPEDFEAIFTGNIDDHFRIGLSIAKKSLKLYTDFYSSDIIIASPLGLRTIIGSEDDNERETDFLSSIEILIMDQIDVFFMQNWEHVLEFMKHLHQQPTSSHGVNFSRIRMSYINGWSSLYRQTLLFSHVNLPEINSIFNKFCHNYEGKVVINKPNETGLISNIIIPLPQIYRKFQAENYMDVIDKRFEFFISKILPELRCDLSSSRTLIFISSYFDFVRLRNYFNKEEINHAPLCEYAKEKELSKARQKFFHRKVEFMLYTERLHFFHRYRIRGVDQIIFYELPIWPNFYPELCNNMADQSQSNNRSPLTCTVLFSKYDMHRLCAVCGLERTNQMIASNKESFLFVASNS